MLDHLNELTRSVDQLSKEAREIRLELVRKTRVLWAVMIAGFIVTVVIVGAAYAVTFNNTEAIEKNNRKLCPMLELSVQRPGDPRPTTPRGALVTKRAMELYKAYGCDRIEEKQ